ncbi:hypothetical protein DYB25_011615 [Aphanomyces astaci]|uniref:Myb/SANT-like domain-containing protein n=1 Tax=Aphanomyces astaci TaxID=112090 RepID=A0A397BAK4_APHAT|nr:hypothetical protein DYB25_011615 [Aphanomyces astaci]
MNTTRRKLRNMASVDGTRASWTAERDEFLVAALQAQVIKGKRSDSGFKKETWAEVTSAFNLRFVTMYHTKVLGNMRSCLRKRRGLPRRSSEIHSSPFTFRAEVWHASLMT